MKFQPGDLVTYRDQFTQNGNFDGAQVLLVLKTMIPKWCLESEPAPEQRIFVQNLKRGLRGWDFAFGYVKMRRT